MVWVLTELCSGMQVVGVHVCGGVSCARASGGGFSTCTSNPHCPLAQPPTMLGAAPLSPYCTVATPPAELPKQVMFPPIRLLPTSTASGSAKVLLTMVVFPLTCSRSVPSQHDCSPLMLRLPPIELSSKSV